MSGHSTTILITLVLYKLLLVGVGIWASRRSTSESDFLVAGQGLGPWVSGLSYAASTSSAWVLIGFTGFVYANGLSALWMIPGIWGGYITVWLLFGPRLRAETEAKGHVTLTDFLVADLGGPMRRAIAWTATAFIVFCFVFYIAAQFGAAANAFSSQFEMGRLEAVLVGSTIILVYSLLGGFWAVSLTDTIQGALMAVVAILLPTAAFLASGGFGGLAEAIAQTPASYQSITGGLAPHLFLGFVLGVWGVGVGALGQPHLLVRLMAVKDEAARQRGFAIAMAWAVIIYIGMTTLALSARALLGEGATGESLFYQLAADLLPPVIAGIVIAAVLSAIMSTVDSILLSAAAAISHDTGLAARRPRLAVLFARLAMVLIAVIAVWLTLSVPASVFSRVLFAWAALGAAFGPIVLVKVLGRSPSASAVWWAMVSGFALTVFFNALGQMPEQSGLVEMLRQLAILPGDPFERVFPWVPALAILVLGSRKASLPREDKVSQ
ncbi:MAG: sodium/proline symporter [Maricaulis sp.]|uniref:sodium/proline symporter n=1 Tax=Maricaulis sp. TaxID=1486257 RepID=UPI002621F324|nr:sodium/proline symporter [Maricaulis sp.]MDM7983119.1 sodium/proline symporter [Maricaulis sp.]